MYTCAWTSCLTSSLSVFKKALCNRKSATDVALRPSLNTISRQKTKGGWSIKRGKCNVKKKAVADVRERLQRQTPPEERKDTSEVNREFFDIHKFRRADFWLAITSWQERCSIRSFVAVCEDVDRALWCEFDSSDTREERDPTLCFIKSFFRQTQRKKGLMQPTDVRDNNINCLLCEVESFFICTRTALGWNYFHY